MDDDTMGAIAGSIAEAYYGIDESLRDKALEYLDETLGGYLTDFRHSVQLKGAAKS